MIYIERLKNLKKVSLAILVLHMVSILVVVITFSIMMTSAAKIDRNNMSHDEYNRHLNNLIGSFMFAWFILMALSIVNLILWVISMVQAFSLTTTTMYSPDKHGDLSTLKVFSVINGLTLGIGLFVLVNGALNRAESVPVTSNEKLEQAESPKKATKTSNTEDKIKKIDSLLEKGVITKEEHKDLKKQILIKDLEN